MSCRSPATSPSGTPRPGRVSRGASPGRGRRARAGARGRTRLPGLRAGVGDQPVARLVAVVRRPGPPAAATARARRRPPRRAAPGSAAARAADVAWCSLGITSTCVGACGLMSRKARTRSVSWTTSAGISPATMRQNRQSLTDADPERAAPSPGVGGQRPSGCVERARARRRAAAPAVEVRSTSAPSRTACGAGGAEGHDLAVGQAALGADDDGDGARRGIVQLGQRTAGLLVQHEREVGVGEQPADLAGGHRLGHLGQPRTAGLLARGPGGRRATSPAPLSTRSSRQRVTQRAAVHGTIRSTPSSVARSTASGPRSPLGSACTSTNSGVGAGTSKRARDRAPAGPAGPAPSTSPSATGRGRRRRARARPAVSRSTSTACRPSAPSTRSSSPSGQRVDQEQRGAVQLGDAGLGASRLSDR